MIPKHVALESLDLREGDEGNEQKIAWARLRSILQQQDQEIASINSKLDKLDDVKSSIAILESKVDMMIALSNTIHQVNNVQSTHALALRIIGLVTTIALPLLAGWSTKLNTEINSLQNKIVRIETLQENKK